MCREGLVCGQGRESERGLVPGTNYAEESGTGGSGKSGSLIGGSAARSKRGKRVFCEKKPFFWKCKVSVWTFLKMRAELGGIDKDCQNPL